VAALESVGRYLLEVNDLTTDRLRQVLQSALEPQVLESIMTEADRLREEGRAEGRVQGRAEGRAELVLKQLALRFGPLPHAAIARVRAAAADELDRLAEGVLSAVRLEDLLP
jgi:predicted transposase YdaD